MISDDKYLAYIGQKAWWLHGKKPGARDAANRAIYDLGRKEGAADVQAELEQLRSRLADQATIEKVGD